MNAVLPERATPRAAERAPASRPMQVDPKPALTVVDPRYRTPAQRRARARVMGVLVLLVVACALFGLVSSHVALTQGQFRLEDMRAEAEAEQDRYERLRLEVAELESPGRIVAAAQERLGMVPPPGITYLSPVGPVSDAPVDDAGTAAAEDWSTVKRQLASRP